ncbi:MAG: cellulase family glycosylhydrolase [Verrucomicrobia bacterium]|nr:cellulase family glycosylhydrolase [Verrucomicrobiota bacterium]
MNTKHLTRRQFLRSTAVALAGCATAMSAADLSSASGQKKVLPTPTASRLPRWRGFNLLEKFIAQPGGNPPYRESDFEWIAELGFDFVRLPMSYLCWSDPTDWLKLRDEELKHVDQTVEFGRKHGVHVNLNFHRAPGYCVNPPKEPLSLWNDEKALEACAFHWAHFAKRFKGIPNSQVTFDLLNEPGEVPQATYTRVVKRLVEAIRAEDPERLIIADGLSWGTKPVATLAEFRIAQSTRGYGPTRISHWKAGWMSGSDQWPEPTWPLTIKSGNVWDKERLHREYIEPWKALEGRGVGVHVGEWGAFQHTPHKVVLAWMRDWLELWQEAGWGWALWNFRGSFGILDSNRADVAYEHWRGHKLDRQMLELIQAH